MLRLHHVQARLLLDFPRDTSLLEQAVAEIPTGQFVHVYVSQANGDNANTGLDPAQPVLTAQGYLDKFNFPPARGRCFHFDSATHPAPSFPVGWGQYEPIAFIGDGAGQAGDDGQTEIQAPAVAQAGTTTLIVQNPVGLTTAFVGATLEVLDGAAAGAKRTICRIAGTSIYVPQAIAGFAAGDSYRIYEPAALVEFAGGTLLQQWEPVIATPFAVQRYPVLPKLLLQDVAITSDGTTGGRVETSHVVGLGIDIQAGPLNLTWGGAMWGAFDAGTERIWRYVVDWTSQMSPGAPNNEATFQSLWGGWGVRVGTTVVGAANGCMVMDDAGFGVLTFAGVLRCGGTRLVNSGAGAIAVIVLSDFAFYVRTASNCFSVEEGTLVLSASGTGILDAESSAQPSLNVLRHGKVYLSGGLYTSLAAVGARATSCGRIVYQGGAATVVGFPAGSDLQVDAVAPVAFATIAASGAFIANGGTIQQRE